MNAASAADDIPDLDHDPRVIRVSKRPIPVTVAFAARDDAVETLEGRVEYRVGDALVTGVRGERWPIERAGFLASYDPVSPTRRGDDGHYIKRPQQALAVCLEQPIAVHVGWQADPLVGHPGDWLLRYPDGSHGVVRDDIFRETYDRS